MVNDNMDICVRMRFRQAKEEAKDGMPYASLQSYHQQTSQQPSASNSIYYYESIDKDAGSQGNLSKGLFGSQDRKLDGFISRPEGGETKFLLNEKYLFTWDQREIRYYELGEKFSGKPGKLLSFSIPAGLKNPRLKPEARIQEIRCGSAPEHIVIIVR